jgi:hypothetical protein
MLANPIFRDCVIPYVINISSLPLLPNLENIIISVCRYFPRFTFMFSFMPSRQHSALSSCPFDVPFYPRFDVYLSNFGSDGNGYWRHLEYKIKDINNTLVYIFLCCSYKSRALVHRCDLMETPYFPRKIR